MGPKKKGKGSKLARMTEEEKIRYLQHRAAIEEEARRRKEQLISTFMKNKLKHEEAFTRLNLAKINQQWRHLLRKYKCTELKDEMKALWNSFETTMNLKNNIIDTLLSDLEDAEDQYSMMFQSHSEEVARLIGLHQERLGKLFNIYKSQRESLLQKGSDVRLSIENDCEQNCEHLQAIIFGMNARHKTEQKQADSVSTERQDELRNQMLTDIEKAEETRLFQIERLWQNLQQVLRDYNNSIAPMKIHYKSLCEKDTRSSAELLKHCDTINKYSEMIQNLKQQLVSKQKQHDEEVKKLKKDQTNLAQEFQKLRTKVTNENKTAHLKLTHMSVVGSKVIKDLEFYVQKGENILQINLKCLKFETQTEKILPSYCRRPEEKTIEEEDKEGKVEDSETMKDIIPEPFDKLGNFWHQYNEILLECQALRLHRDSCLAENKQLKRLLRHYLNTLVRPSSVPSITQARTLTTETRPITTRNGWKMMNY